MVQNNKIQRQPNREAELRKLLQERIVIIDGAMGTTVQQYNLDEAAYRGGRFTDWKKDLKGNHDLLNITRPDVIEEVHRKYLEAGLRVTVNTDNRLVSSTTMTVELERAVTAFHLTPSDVRYVLINGFKSAFLPYEEKGKLLRTALAEMDRLFDEARAAEGEPSRDLL